MSDQPQYQCARCQWFDGVASQGFCRKDSPRMAGRMAVWPLVVDADHQWCGQFSPKRHAPWTATTTAVSPSDRRALDNARTSIRKAEREAGARATQPEEPPNHLRR